LLDFLPPEFQLGRSLYRLGFPIRYIVHCASQKVAPTRLLDCTRAAAPRHSGTAYRVAWWPAIGNCQGMQCGATAVACLL
jgi:hypothetical protein